MRTHTKREQYSPMDVLTELAVEGTSSLVEAQRTLLDLAKQENDILFKGMKERIRDFVPGVAMADMVRRSVDTLIGMQHELLTATARQTMEWVESEKAGKNHRSARLMELAREAVESFTRAQQKFLDVVAQESVKATGGKLSHHEQAAKKTEVAVLAREAANAFIDAQKKLLDVMSQQVNVNLDLSTKSLGMMSPARLVPTANLTEKRVKDFFKAETEMVGALIKPRKPKAVRRAKPGRSHSKHHKSAAA